MNYPTDEEFEAWREEALADEARTAEPAPEPRSNKRGALALLLEHHKPDPCRGEGWDDVLRGAKPRDMADAVWQRHGFDQAERPPLEHDDLWKAAAWLLNVSDWAPELWCALLTERRRFLHPEARDLR